MSAQMAPNFTLEHIAGRNVSLSEFQGRSVVLVFSGRDSVEQAQKIGQTIRSRYDLDNFEMDGPQIDIHPPAPFRTCTPELPGDSRKLRTFSFKSKS